MVLPDEMVAWVESPLQAINAFEYSAHSQVALVIVTRTGAVQLETTVLDLLERQNPGRTSGRLVRGLSRRVIPLDLLLSRRNWVIGDIFSGQVRLMITLARPRQIGIVDDGAITLHLCRLIAGGRPIGRPGVRESRFMRVLGAVTGRVLRRMAKAGRITLFSYQSPDEPAIQAMRDAGIRTVQNDFTWLRGVGSSARSVDSDLEPLFDGNTRLLLGNANVADGFSTVADHVDWVTQETDLGPVLYAPHRRESPTLVDRVAAIDGVSLLQIEVPIELRLAGVTRPLRITGRPTSAVDTLARILDGTGSTITVRPNRRLEFAA